MTQIRDKLYNERRIVLTFDICSSTDILEDLHRTENIEVWRNFLIWVKKYLNKKSKSESFDLYKFTGDGWIILFDFNYPGEKLIIFVENFCEAFKSKLEQKVLNILEAPPEITGLTFGMDRGTLVKIIMNRRREYVGRPINVACRLQSSIKDKDDFPQYKLMMPNHLYNHLKKDLSDHKCVNAKRKLRNIAGDKVIRCRKIFLSMAKTKRRRA